MGFIVEQTPELHPGLYHPWGPLSPIHVLSIPRATFNLSQRIKRVSQGQQKSGLATPCSTGLMTPDAFSL